MNRLLLERDGVAEEARKDFEIASHVTIALYRALAAIDEHPEAPMTVLAQATGMNDSTLSKQTKRLKQKGYISSEKDINDSRTRRASITKTGTQKLASWDAIAKDLYKYYYKAVKS